MSHLLCFGLGYSARRLARRLLRQGWRVTGTARSDAAVSRLVTEGFDGVIFNGSAKIDGFASLARDVTHILLSVPPGVDGDPVFARHGQDIGALAPQLKWAGYLSTTGVYGDRQGGWVDESGELLPATERGRRRVQAEADWQELHSATGLPLHVFRLAGIYGPGSNQMVSLLNGKSRRVIKPGQVFSRVHVDDIASTLQASLEKPNPGRIYNVCDDEAAPPQVVVAHAATLLNRPAPPEVDFEDAEMSPMGRSFYAESKRVSNDRIKQELGVELAYPTYREGLSALLETVRR
ncbi:MAG: SDR family oxidoreductase [Alphaproteobacteria bacterium]|nr:SDR family oxidoreductase [Alphaproteobacteria bacterium]